ncbi:MAG: alpha/beta hydrolase [Lentimicrobiaceae bacterium]|jgi:pimeloyl-ACP methyl ester carboxylesterase|nr:alpha/beta hydrolase [Lentimicrobiaceae bacterium]MDY0025940.1 alpha/beta hydrolase [Lentimicrobium sp.]HAH59113.1 alpha/beta hydrolase [Bacteroidales bacterium]
MKLFKQNILLIATFLVLIPAIAAAQKYDGFLSPFSNLKPIEQMEELQYPYQVHKVKIGSDTEIAYVDEGKGEQVIVLIHGLGSYLPAWKKNIEGLKSSYRVIALDLPGYGKSSKQPHSGKMSYYAEIVKQFADALNLNEITLGGHSMGGQIAMVAALNYPDLVKNLILVAPAGFEKFTEGQKQWFRNVMTFEGVKNTTTEDIQTNLAVNFYNMPKDAEFMITDRIIMRDAEDFDHYVYAIVQSVNGMVDEPVLDVLPNIKQPALIIFGENDNLIPNRFLNPGKTSKVAQVGKERLPNSKLVMIPKAGHFVQFEKSGEVNNAIKAFLL